MGLSRYLWYAFRIFGRLLLSIWAWWMHSIRERQQRRAAIKSSYTRCHDKKKVIYLKIYYGYAHTQTRIRNANRYTYTAEHYFLIDMKVMLSFNHTPAIYWPANIVVISLCAEKNDHRARLCLAFWRWRNICAAVVGYKAICVIEIVMGLGFRLWWDAKWRGKQQNVVRSFCFSLLGQCYLLCGCRALQSPLRLRFLILSSVLFFSLPLTLCLSPSLSLSYRRRRQHRRMAGSLRGLHLSRYDGTTQNTCHDWAFFSHTHKNAYALRRPTKKCMLVLMDMYIPYLAYISIRTSTHHLRVFTKE